MRYGTATLLAAMLLNGCASTETYFRSEHPFYVSADRQGAQLPGGAQVSGLIDFYCIDMHGESQTADSLSPSGRCLYISADVRKLIGDPALGESGDITTKDSVLRAKRSLIASALLNLSEQNCATFLSRAFANKAVTNATANIFRDLVTGVSAGLASGSPGISAGLDVANLLIGTTVKEVDKTFYVEKAFQAMETAIKAKRTEIRGGISRKLRREPYIEYTITDALSDIRTYADACSIRAGLAELQGLADRKKEDVDSKK